jgi:hypothetical protein
MGVWWRTAEITASKLPSIRVDICRDTAPRATLNPHFARWETPPRVTDQTTITPVHARVVGERAQAHVAPHRACVQLEVSALVYCGRMPMS